MQERHEGFNTFGHQGIRMLSTTVPLSRCNMYCILFCMSCWAFVPAMLGVPAGAACRGCVCLGVVFLRYA